MLLPEGQEYKDGNDRVGCLPTNTIVPVGFAPVEPLVPYDLIVHPHPQGGLPASSLTQLAFHWISQVCQLFNSPTV
jgi:hypothetical protein